MQSPKRVRLDDSRSSSVEEVSRPPPKYDVEDEVEREQCSICLQSIEDRTVIPTCSHEFCFECLLVWTEQSRRCPLCTQPIGDYLIHKIRSKYDYQKHYLPPLRSTSPARLGQLSAEQSAAVLRTARREREWGRRARRQREEADAFDRAISRRRWLYEHDLYAKHVASNPYTRYRPHPTPAQFSASADLQSRAAIFVRRELRIWPNLDVEFLTTFIISLMKSIDIRSESAIKLLAEFLDMDQPYVQGRRYKNAEHFAHEVYSYLRSPYRDLAVYDSVVQYDAAEHIPPPPQIEPPCSSRWRPSVSRSRSPSPVFESGRAPEPGRSRRRDSPSRTRNSARDRRARNVDVGSSEQSRPPRRRRSSLTRRSRSREFARGMGDRKQSYPLHVEEVPRSSGRRGQVGTSGECGITPIVRAAPPSPSVETMDSAIQLHGRDSDEPADTGRNNKGKAKAPVREYVDLTESDPEQMETPPTQDASAESTDGTPSKRSVGDTALASESLAISTAPSQVLATDAQSTTNPNLRHNHMTEGRIPVGTDGGANSQGYLVAHSRPRLNLRDSVHAHLNGRSRRPREAAQIQSADLIRRPTMGASSSGREAQGRTEAASDSLLTRIMRPKTPPSLKNSRADKAPGPNDDSAFTVSPAGPSFTSSSDKTTFTNFPIDQASVNSSGMGDFRQRLQRKLAEERQRNLSQPQTTVPSSDTPVGVDTATLGFANFAENHDASHPLDKAAPRIVADPDADALAAEGKLRLQARLRTRLAAAKKGMVDTQL